MIEAATLFVAVIVLAGLVATWTLLREAVRQLAARIDQLESRDRDDNSR